MSHRNRFRGRRLGDIETSAPTEDEISTAELPTAATVAPRTSSSGWGVKIAFMSVFALIAGGLIYSVVRESTPYYDRGIR